MNEEVRVLDTYMASEYDCFQLLGKPVDGVGIEYLVKDISITLK